MPQTISTELIIQMTGPLCYCDTITNFLITNLYEFLVTDSGEPLI